MGKCYRIKETYQLNAMLDPDLNNLQKDIFEIGKLNTS